MLLTLYHTYLFIDWIRKLFMNSSTFLMVATGKTTNLQDPEIVAYARTEVIDTASFTSCSNL